MAGETISLLAISIPATFRKKKGLNDLACHSIPLTRFARLKQSRQNFTCDDYHNKVNTIRLAYLCCNNYILSVDNSDSSKIMYGIKRIRIGTGCAVTYYAIRYTLLLKVFRAISSFG